MGAIFAAQSRDDLPAVEDRVVTSEMRAAGRGERRRAKLFTKTCCDCGAMCSGARCSGCNRSYQGKTQSERKRAAKAAPEHEK